MFTTLIRIHCDDSKGSILKVPEKWELSRGLVCVSVAGAPVDAPDAARGGWEGGGATEL